MLLARTPVNNLTFSERFTLQQLRLWGRGGSEKLRKLAYGYFAPCAWADWLAALVRFEGVAFVFTIWRLIEHLASVYLTPTWQHFRGSSFANMEEGIFVLNWKSERVRLLWVGIAPVEVFPLNWISWLKTPLICMWLNNKATHLWPSLCTHLYLLLWIQGRRY